MACTIRDCLVRTRAGAIAIAVAALLVAAPARADPQTAPEYQAKHLDFLQQARGAHPALVFLGDSINAGWLGRGAETWNSRYRPLGALDFAINGDTVPGLLWRIRNGEIDGLDPKVAVVLIGSTDVSTRVPAATIVQGIKDVVGEVRMRLPKASILLLSIFPRGAAAGNSERRTIKEINLSLGKTIKAPGVHLLDVGDAFLEVDGSISPDMMWDGVHPTGKAYAIWAKAMAPELDKLMQNAPAPAR